MSGNHRRAPARRASFAGRWIWWTVLAGLVVAGIAAVALTAGGSSSSNQLEVAKRVTVGGTVLPRLANPASDPAIGSAAPTLVGETFGRKGITIGDNGEPHVVLFVAHWCPHCQAEVPRIVTMRRNGQTAGVSVIAVATGTQANQPNYPPSAWLKSVGWPYPVLVDTATGTAAAAFGLPAYPYLVFVDAHDNIAARVTGEIAPTDLAKMFAALAAGKAVPIPNSAAASQG